MLNEVMFFMYLKEGPGSTATRWAWSIVQPDGAIRACDGEGFDTLQGCRADAAKYGFMAAPEPVDDAGQVITTYVAKWTPQ